MLLCWAYGIKMYEYDVWWNQSYWLDNCKYPIIYYKDKGSVDCRVGQEVKMGETELGEDILYKVIKVWRSKGSDFMFDTDALNCDLKFSKIQKP